MTANTPASRKAKGATLQRWFRDKLLETFSHLQPDDVRSTSMGASGEDLLLSPLARSSFPFSVECKNTEKINVWSAYEQATANSKEFEPIVVIKKARKKPLIVVDAEYFINLLIDK